MQILYVTTFNDKIFEASGSKMLKSFFETQINRDILCCYENLNPKKSFKALDQSRLISLNLSESIFLNSWLKENSDIIPIEYGGTAIKEKKPEVFLPWNFRAAGWFRKIVSLEESLKYISKYDAIVFVDSDSKFLKNIDDKIFEKIFNNSDYFYHWGEERKKKNMGVESGFIGFKTNEFGIYVLNYWINKFKNKNFTRYMRWDDGGMFCNVLHELNFKGGKDLVENYKDNGKSQSHVIERGIFANYLIHDKGLHKRLGLTNEKK